MKWFKHDTDALQDAKIERLVMKYGLEGYGLYFACVELIAASLSSDDCSFELEHDEVLLAHRFKKTPQKIKEMLAYLVELGLFQYNEDSKNLMCIQLLKRVDNTMAQNPEIKKIMSNGDFKKLKETLNNFKSFKAEQIRTDKIRTDKNRDLQIDSTDKDKKEYAPDVRLTEKEHFSLIQDYGKDTTKRAIVKLSDYKGAHGKKYKSDYRAILQWVIEAITGQDRVDAKKPIIPKCPKCNTELSNEIRNGKSHCMHCDADITGVINSPEEEEEIPFG